VRLLSLASGEAEQCAIAAPRSRSRRRLCCGQRPVGHRRPACAAV